MYKMSLPIHQVTIYFILISVFDHTNGQNISIIRGERDVFTNPADCFLAKAACFDRNCTYCQCKSSHKTFVATRRKYGECVPNEYLDYVTSFNLSFLAQDTTKKLCLVYYKTTRYRYVQVNACNSNAISQRWLWTRNGQLLNLDLLECITVGWQYQHVLILTKCIPNTNWLWTCDRNDPYHIWQPLTTGYLSCGDHGRNVYIHWNSKKAPQWKRYGSNQTLCSQAVGCDTFQDGTSLVVLNQTICHENSECRGEKEISIDMKVTNCSLMPNKVEYLHKDEWQHLVSVKAGSFDVVANESKAFLKWDLTKTPRSWKGLIVKVQFECGKDQHNKDTHCVLIKYSGRFTGFDETDKQKDESKDGNDKTQIAVIVVCVLITIFVIGIAAFFAYRNKDRLAVLIRKSTRRQGAERAEHTSTTPSSGDSNNPIYNSSDRKYSAQNECELYEGTNPEHVYHYANPVLDIEASTPPKETHHYALPDSSVGLAEKTCKGDPTGGNVLTQNASELDNSQDKTAEAHVYEVLVKN